MEEGNEGEIKFEKVNSRAAALGRGGEGRRSG